MTAEQKIALWHEVLTIASIRLPYFNYKKQCFFTPNGFILEIWSYHINYDDSKCQLIADWPAAAIFKDFIDKQKNEGGHRIKAFPIPQSWPRKQAVDPGIINTSKLWVAHDPVNDFHYVYRSTMADRKPATEHAKDDLELEKLNNEHVILRAIGAVSEKYWREDYESAGAEGVVAPDTNDVEEGIDRVVTLLKGHRLYFFDDDEGVMELIREILEYAREVDDMGNATDKIKDKSKFHRVDTLRYLAIQLAGKMTNFNVETRQDRYA